MQAPTTLSPTAWQATFFKQDKVTSDCLTGIRTKPRILALGYSYPAYGMLMLRHLVVQVRVRWSWALNFGVNMCQRAVGDFDRGAGGERRG